MNIFVKKFFLLANVLVICTFLSFFVNAQENGPSSDIKTNKTHKITVTDENEEKVIISIINFGRSNPFEPYKEVKRTEKKQGNIEDIPYPPKLKQEMDPGYQLLIGSRVNGILYDPTATSVVIVNVKDEDYMLHKGDVVHGILVENIAKNNVTLKYGTNSYTVGVGNIMEDEMEGEVQYAPVKRKQKIFAETGHRLPDLKLEGLTN